MLLKLKQEKKHLTLDKTKKKLTLLWPLFDSTVPWWPKWWSRGRSSRCGGRDRTAAWALISAHSAIISVSQIVPLSFRLAKGCALIFIEPTKIAQQLTVSLDFKLTAGCRPTLKCFCYNIKTYFFVTLQKNIQPKATVDISVFCQKWVTLGWSLNFH